MSRLFRAFQTSADQVPCPNNVRYLPPPRRTRAQLRWPPAKVIALRRPEPVVTTRQTVLSVLGIVLFFAIAIAAVLTTVPTSVYLPGSVFPAWPLW